jgi:Adenylate and Guanylate cyclase catalytic domain
MPTKASTTNHWGRHYHCRCHNRQPVRGLPVGVANYPGGPILGKSVLPRARRDGPAGYFWGLRQDRPRGDPLCGTDHLERTVGLVSIVLIPERSLAGWWPGRRIQFRIGIHLGDVVEESDGDLMGDGVNIAARAEGIAKPGAICLSEDAYRQVKSRLDLAVSDLGAIKLKNIAEPVRVYSLAVGKPAQAKPTKPAPSTRRSIPVLLGAGIVALIVIAGSAWFFLGANRPATVTSNAPAARADAAHLSIVVLPFRNLSDDPSQDYFADGITENLTTDLSRIRNSFVIARNTAFTFKGKNIADQLSRALRDDHGVRLRNPLQPSRKVRRLPDNRLLLGRTGADQIANYDQSGGNTDPSLQCCMCMSPACPGPDIMPWRALAGLKCPPAESKLGGSHLPTAWM